MLRLVHVANSISVVSEAAARVSRAPPADVLLRFKGKSFGVHTPNLAHARFGYNNV